MPKERSVNPAQAQRKAEKQREIAKNKKITQGQRNEKLAKRNPERLQKQIDELKELESRGVLRPKDKESLVQLQRDLHAIRRARDALGDAAPSFPTRERQGRGDARREQQERRQHLGKRRRDDDDAHSSDSGTDVEARSIPMPRDTPPPIPRTNRRQNVAPGMRNTDSPSTAPAAAAPAQLVYSSAPQIRDLKKEATKFVPAAVAQKQKQIQGRGRLLEAEELDKLEKGGYYPAPKPGGNLKKDVAFGMETAAKPYGDREEGMDEELQRLEAELQSNSSQNEGKTPQRLQVAMEEVEDAGD